MPYSKRHLSLVAAALAFTSLAVADEDPRHERHELMEGFGDAAKPVGQMLKGEREFDAAELMKSLRTFQDGSMHFGDLFPPGSETGEDTEAAPAIWEDRDGFEDALAQLREAVGDAIAAEPATLDAAKPVVSEVFNACKNCHDNYRIQDEE